MQRFTVRSKSRPGSAEVHNLEAATAADALRAAAKMFGMDTDPFTQTYTMDLEAIPADGANRNPLDRDPIDPSVIKFAVHAWQMDEMETGEEDIALEAVLLEQGVIRPDEVIHEFAPHVAGIHVVLDDGTEFVLHEVTGDVHAIR